MGGYVGGELGQNLLACQDFVLPRTLVPSACPVIVHLMFFTYSAFNE